LVVRERPVGWVRERPVWLGSYEHGISFRLGLGAFLGDAVRDAEEADRGDQADAADDVAQG